MKMLIIVSIFTCLLLSGCSHAATDYQWRAAEELCKDAGGVRYVHLFNNPSANYIRCQSGAKHKIPAFSE